MRGFKDMKLNPNRKVTLSVKQLQDLKKNATKEAVKVTQLFPVWVLRNQGWGEKRLKRFLEDYSDLIDSYNRGYLNLEDIATTLDEETGVRIE